VITANKKKVLLSPELHKRLKKQAKSQHKFFHAYVEELLQSTVKHTGNKRKTTLTVSP